MGHLSQLVNLRAWIFALTWSIVSLRPWPQSVVGGRHYLCAHQERLHVHSVRDRCILLGGSSGGCCWIRCALQTLPLQALNQAIVRAKETTGLIHHSDHG
ncbi:hypothetical protein B1A60_11105 [Corynebacterium diphtheriae]|nr:hypothetical protein B1A63_11115 [Corynebacterium diphtheriae]OSQ04664.1 hypothetical protein B1A60_11105 [Corynebacterium diphtheriae]